ncbi:MAG: alpha/beta fold hydrolase [Candidatus Omnitrophota bacterium]
MIYELALMAIGIFLLAILLLFVGFLFVKPIRTLHLVSKINPSRSYQESLRRINDLRILDGEDVAPDGRLIFLTHGDKTQNAIVFFHGGTNSPRQFETLGRIFYEKGYNVLIPRIPHHGLKDRMTESSARLTALELTKLCDESMDIAQGLGKHVSVVGLSMGANMAGWIAQNRSDVDKAVVIAPFWGWKELPVGLLKPAINLLSALPNIFLWWDKKEKTALAGPASAYYRFSTRGLAQIMLLGWLIIKEAGSFAPKTRTIVVITNALDDSVNENIFNRVIDDWQGHIGVKITRFQFDKSFGVLHDLIDPEQPYQKTAVVYPKLIELIES